MLLRRGPLLPTTKLPLQLALLAPESTAQESRAGNLKTFDDIAESGTAGRARR